jgi:hypothetical protein
VVCVAVPAGVGEVIKGWDRGVEVRAARQHAPYAALDVYMYMLVASSYCSHRPAECLRRQEQACRCIADASPSSASRAAVVLGALLCGFNPQG